MELETTTQKAAKVRADIKSALKAGTLGTLPSGLKISVRTEYASLMSAISVRLRNVPDGWAFTRTEVEPGYSPRRITPECKALGAELLAIVARHYDWDGRHRFADVSLDDGMQVA
jgi:hypothetical protein